jgi:hypothetical protein
MKGLKTGGRQSGTPNKITADMRERIALMITREMDTMEANEMTLSERRQSADIISKLLPYVLPRAMAQSECGEALVIHISDSI